jgi:Flp pilus assembly protein TadG
MGMKHFGKRLARGLRGRDAGTAMVEMVVVTPVLLMLVFGIAEFGVAFAQWQTLSNAAREGARVGVLFRVDCDAGAVQADVTNTVNTVTGAIGIAAPTVDASGLCDGTGSPVTVNVTSPYSFQVLPGLAGVPSTINLTATSVMRTE